MKNGLSGSKSRAGQNEPNRLDRHTPAEWGELAASLCRARGAQLTPLRRDVLELLWVNERPMGAYELLDVLEQRNHRSISPPTVYRALEFLISQRLVSKIESRNTYVPCAHPERPHDCLFFICNSCGTSFESEDQHIEDLLTDIAGGLGYRVTRRVIEVEGTCVRCLSSELA